MRLLLTIEMEKPPLPMNTVLDSPGRDPGLDDETVAILKEIYLTQSHVPAFRTRGMSNAEIIDTLHGMVQAGFLEIIQNGDKVGLVPTDAGAAVAGFEIPVGHALHKQQARARRRQRRRLFRR
jgi:hypothetical protein